ncbi:MAG: hypothetical protein ACRED0_00325 [Gammaproteobacteria bacterium]
MTKNVTQKLIESHLIEGHILAGESIALRVDQTLTQDATGTLVMWELEAMGIPRVKTELVFCGMRKVGGRNGRVILTSLATFALQRTWIANRSQSLLEGQSEM